MTKKITFNLEDIKNQFQREEHISELIEMLKENEIICNWFDLKKPKSYILRVGPLSQNNLMLFIFM